MKKGSTRTTFGGTAPPSSGCSSEETSIYYIRVCVYGRHVRGCVLWKKICLECVFYGRQYIQHNIMVHVVHCFFYNYLPNQPIGFGPLDKSSSALRFSCNICSFVLPCALSGTSWVASGP